MTTPSKISLQARFTIFLASISLLFLVLFSIVVFVQAKKKSYAFAESSLLALLDHEWDHIELPKDDARTRNAAPHFKDVYLRVWKSGVLLYDSFPKNFPETFPPTGELARGKLFRSFSKAHNGHEYELQGVYDFSSTDAYLSFLRRILIMGCFSAAILLIPLSLFSTRIFLKPFRTLAEATTELTADRLTFRFEEGPIQDEYGTLTRNFNSLLDRIEKAFLQIKRFALNASHELRTPLAVIISQGELALRRERSSQEYRTALEKIVVPAKRLREIVNRLLFLAELDRIEREGQIANIEVGEAIDSIVATLKEAYAGLHKETALIHANGKVNYIGNREVFDVVMSNLVENAFKFSRDKIHITYMQSTEGIVVIVEDDGPGIPQEYLGTVLEPLSRAQFKNGVQGEKRGAGLGLSIVKACLDSITGTVRLSPSSLGGLCASVIFPQPSPAPTSMRNNAQH